MSSFFSLGFNTYVEARMDNADTREEYEKCTVTFSAESSSREGFLTWSAVGATALLTGGFIWRKRRLQRRARINLNDEDTPVPQRRLRNNNNDKPFPTPFVEMTDRGAMV